MSWPPPPDPASFGPGWWRWLNARAPEPLLNALLSFVGNAAFPRAARWVRRKHRLGARGTARHVAFRVLWSVAVTAQFVRFLRFKERLDRERAALAERLGREPTDDELYRSR